MRPERVTVVSLLLYCLLIAGCSQWRYQFGAAVPEGFEDQAQGRSMASVLAQLGPPLRFAASDDEIFMAWESWRIRESKVGFSLGFIGVDILEVDWGDARIDGDFLVVTFDQGHSVRSAYRARRDDSVGGGAALQPLAGFVSVVDVDDLLLPLPAHRWGAGQLRPLPETLNNASRPGMGDSAIEQRGTPVGAGQRSQGWPD